MIDGLPTGRKLLVTVAALAGGLALVLGLAVPGSLGAYSAQVSNNGNAITTNGYFTCTSAATGLGAALAWPLDDPAGLAGPARDVSGNKRAGVYSLTGVTYRQVTTLCPRDLVNNVDYGTVLDGQTGYVHYDTAFPLDNTFTESLWFSTSTTSGGRLIGFGSSNVGLSAQYDRMIWMTNSGNLVFGVYPNAVKTVASPLAYNDGQRHQVVASLGTNGMRLYVDGALVASDATTTTAETYTLNAMYLRVGYDNLAGWPNQPSSSYFKGVVRFADYFTSTLTAAQVAALYAAGSGT